MPRQRSNRTSRSTPTTRRLGALASTATAVAVVAAGVLGPAPAVQASTMSARAGTLSPSDQVMHDRLVHRSAAARLGPDLAGLVTDAATGEVLWSQTPAERQLPASNTKLVTAVNALSTLGPDHRFTTRVVRGNGPHQVVLVGAGDPSLSGPNLATLARATAAKVRADGLRTVRVWVDDSLFPAPSLAYGWKSSYVPTDVRAVRALVVNQRHVSDTSMDAGRWFARRLEAQGLRVRVVVRRSAPARSATLATVRGQALSTMVATMLRESDNDYAEALHRLVARAAGFAPTWTAARIAQRQVLATVGVDLGRSTLYDGSGLSRADRLAPKVLVSVLSLVFDGAHPRLASMRHNSLAIAGRTGTLAPQYLRYTTSPTRCAAGLIEAKTGSLSGVITLSGFATGADGRTKLFSFLLNKVPSTLTTRRAVDKLAATVTGCW